MASSKRESFFSYPITRRYPVWWFDWLAAAVLLTSTVVFTFVALAADGYVLDAIYVSDLNSTLAQTHWFQKAPFSWLSTISVTCQPAQLTQGGTYFTSNQGLQYTISNLRTVNGDGSLGNTSVIPSTTYWNSPLRDCNVDQIQIYFARTAYGRLPENWWSWSATTAKAVASCLVTSGNETVRVELGASLAPIYSAADLLTTAVALNFTERPAMWWGAQLTAAFFNYFNTALGFQAPDDGSTWDWGHAFLSPNPSVTNYMSEEFFLCDNGFVTDAGGIQWMNDSNTIADWARQAQPGYIHYNLPNISIEVDAFAKSFYSLVLTDFGNMNDSNALATPAGVQYLTSRNDQTLDLKAAPFHAGPPQVQNISALSSSDITYAYPLNTSWQDAVNDAGYVPDLNKVNASTLFAQYLCSVPKMKNGANLVLSVIIADLVFLQVIWQVLNTAMQFWLHRRDPEMNVCQSCRNKARSRSRSRSRSGGLISARSPKSFGRSDTDEYELLNQPRTVV